MRALGQFLFPIAILKRKEEGSNHVSTKGVCG